jgi:hypothetical protein
MTQETVEAVLVVVAAAVALALEYLFWWHLVYPALGALVPYLKG